MTEKKGPIVLTIRREITFSPEAVFDAWLDRSAAARWLFATDGGVMKTVEIDPTAGGEFLIVEQRGEVLAEHFGTYLEIDRPRRLVFAFSAIREETPSRVAVTIEPTPDGSLVMLTHELDPKWSDYQERTAAGWTKLLGNLQRTLQESP